MAQRYATARSSCREASMCASMDGIIPAAIVRCHLRIPLDHVLLVLLEGSNRGKRLLRGWGCWGGRSGCGGHGEPPYDTRGVPHANAPPGAQQVLPQVKEKSTLYSRDDP